MDDLLPGPEDLAFYREHGYWISPVLVPDDVLDAAEHGMRRFYAGDFDTELSETAATRGWQPEDGEVLRKNDYASLRVRELSGLVRFPAIGATAALLAGVAGVRLWHDQLLYKPVDDGEQPNTVGWHTDRQYWQTCTSERMLTAWVAFHDVDESCGTVSFLPGSHRWDVTGLDFFSQDRAALEARIAEQGHTAEPAVARMRRGQVSFHHCRTVHGSGPNHGNEPRRSLAIHLQPDDNRWREHREPDGSLAFHWNDKLVRDSGGRPDYTDPVICPRLWPR